LKQIGRAVARQWLALSIHKDKCPWRAAAYCRQALTINYLDAASSGMGMPLKQAILRDS